MLNRWFMMLNKFHQKLFKIIIWENVMKTTMLAALAFAVFTTSSVWAKPVATDAQYQQIQAVK
jgi:hypothetical protein